MENTTTNNEMALLWFAGLFFGILIIVGIAMYLSERFKDINYAKMELCRAYDKDEYRYWRRELTICRLTIIPFMSYERAKRIVRFFSRGRHAKKENRNDGLTSLLLPSFLGITICAVCLAGGTFAWFTASQTTATQTITAANYKINTSVKIKDSENIINPSQNGIYELKANDAGYQVVLDATESTATTGYCVLELGNTKIYTQQFPSQKYSEKAITIYLDIKEDTTLTIISQWGTSASEEKKFLNGDTYTYGATEPTSTTNKEEKIEQGTTEQTTETTGTDIYTVVSGDTLTSIANKYNTIVDKLMAYNELTSTNIQVGQKIKIPSTDYEIAKAETTATTVQENEQTTTEQDTVSTEQTGNITESDNTISNILN